MKKELCRRTSNLHNAYETAPSYGPTSAPPWTLPETRFIEHDTLQLGHCLTLALGPPTPNCGAFVAAVDYRTPHQRKSSSFFPQGNMLDWHNHAPNSFAYVTAFFFLS